MVVFQSRQLEGWVDFRLITFFENCLVFTVDSEKMGCKEIIIMRRVYKARANITKSCIGWKYLKIHNKCLAEKADNYFSLLTCVINNKAKYFALLKIHNKWLAEKTTIYIF